MILVASATMGALGVGSPVALADEPTYDCSFDAFREDNATGQVFAGQASGFVAHAEGGAVSIRCYITVNGADTGAEVSGSGAGVATAAGAVSFAATGVDDVDICADVTTSHGSFTDCFQATRQQLPPQEAIDAIDGVSQLIEDLTSPGSPIFCTLLRELGGHYPPDIWVDPGDGDVYRGGTRVVDCPPYGDDDGEYPYVEYWGTR